MGLLEESDPAVVALRTALGRRAAMGEPADQPVHTLYWPADRFDAHTVARAADDARRLVQRVAPDAAALAHAIGLPRGPGDASFVDAVWQRTCARLASAPVEDLRIDFEDGYGARDDATEDAHAAAAGDALAEGLRAQTMPPRVGIRIKALTPELLPRAAATLERFVARLAKAAAWPSCLVVTLPKVTDATQVVLAVRWLAALERRHGREPGSIRMEVMVETTESLIAADGRSPLPGIVAAGVPRLLGVHLGVYDFTASLQLPPLLQAPDHPFCDLARGLMRLAVGQRVHLSDGASNVVPAGEDAAVVQAWRVGMAHVTGALRQGIVQGWDMHPGQLAVRHAANIAFWRGQFHTVAPRLAALLRAAARGGAHTAAGEVFDEPATGRALLRAVQRAFRVGAIDAVELTTAGLRPEDATAASFEAVLAHALRPHAP